MRLFYLVSALLAAFAKPLAKYSARPLPELADSSSIETLATNPSEFNALASDTYTGSFQKDALDSSESTSSALQETNADSTIAINDNRMQIFQNSGNQIGSTFESPAPSQKEGNLEKIKCPLLIPQKLCCIGSTWHCFRDWCTMVNDCHECRNLLRVFQTYQVPIYF